MNIQHLSHDHPLILHGENNLVPDDWHSCFCSACGLPIFSTPSYVCSTGCNFFLHKKCAHLPKKLEHFLHRQHPLTLVTESPPEYGEAICVNCINCHCEPDNFIYACLSSGYCNSFLHLLCAFPLEIKILHKSHPHELILLRGESTFRCGACGDEHKGLCYLCHMCGYWLHRDCASLPNTIRHKKHGDGLHTLSLTYALPRRSSRSYCCAICEKMITSLGAYFCGRCRYYAHVKCATEDPELYKPVSSQEIELDPNVVRFPMVNERTSVVPYLLGNTSNKMSISTESTVIEDSSTSVKLCKDKNGHPLIFHDDSDDDDDDNDQGLLRVCDGCVQTISRPYYSCSHSECSNFFLHSCCGNLPPTFLHPAHEEHPLLLLKTPPSLSSKPFSKFQCNCCNRMCNGFAYGCYRCYFFLDIVCAFLPGSITHEAHGRRHVLVLDYSKSYRYVDCCSSCLPNWSYKCSSCLDFQVHAHCALLPSTVGHRFDPHPLELVTSFDENYSSDEHFCEICEEKIKIGNRFLRNWYYRCAQCDQSFHVHCIPSVSLHFSRIKFGGTIRVGCHDCPLTSIRMLTVGSYRCGYCRQIIRGLKDSIAFECSKCDFRIHDRCAQYSDFPSLLKI